jgi:hypothetical protein
MRDPDSLDLDLSEWVVGRLFDRELVFRVVHWQDVGDVFTAVELVGDAAK